MEWGLGISKMNKKERKKVEKALSHGSNPFFYKLSEKDAKDMEDALNSAALRKAKEKAKREKRK